MKLITVILPDSYVKSLEKIGIYTGINRSELLRQAIGPYIIKEIKFAKKLEKELENEKITRFFDYCINCERKLHIKGRKSHLFHKNIEVFELKFCCACYRRFKDISFDDFPAHLIDNIRKKIKAYKKNME
ncbi:hypothetical protein LCGC14_1623010 [marine sediment metagenome]|uniref:Ribbon-helix-helix protein CopG domain-containing protein n=1 Tax=marine sediment metagenome TaxID=412755 RepID=A0A0F9L4L2_9ZZZZ